MSEQTSQHGRGRGRGRGKDLTPNERVAHWVNQREARRLNKERWANRGQDSNLSEVNCENPMLDQQDTHERDEKERSRSKKTPQPQLYIPPSLRQKKAQYTSLNNSFDESSNLSNQGHLTDCPGKVSDDTESKPQASNGPPQARVASKGRGRGRKRPEVEVYVPRALRAVQKQNKEASPICLESSDLKSKTIDQDLVNNSINDQICDESKICPNLLHDNKSSPIPVNDAMLGPKDHSNSTMDPEGSFCPAISPSALGDDEKEQTRTPLFPESTVIQKPPDSGNIHCSTHNPYTFEFYDPAVVAFMPSSIVPIETSENVNNSSTNQHFDSNPGMPNGHLHSSNSYDDSIQNEEKTLNDSNKAQILKTEAITLSDVDNSTNAEVKVATSVSSKCKTDLEQIHVKNETMDEEAFEMELPEPISVSKCGDNPSVGAGVERKSDTAAIEEDAEDSWDTMFDDNGDCLDESLMDELIQSVGKVEVIKPKINYLKYEPKEPDMDMKALGHVVEIYDFSPELATCDLISAFRDFASRGFDVKWVDDTHALGVFSNGVAANEALQMIHPLLKIRPMSQASRQSQSKARHCQEFLQPYKARPETTSIAARRLVAGALGMAPQVSREVRDRERQKLKEFKEKRRQEKQQKKDMWDGSFGKCAMDDV